MQTRVYKDYKKACLAISNYMIYKINQGAIRNLGLATGSTYIYTYYLMHQAFVEGRVDFSDIQTFNLDEYIDIDRSHPQTYHHFMRKHFFDYVNVKKENIHFPPVDSGVDYESYDALIQEKGGLDLVILGIGVNGHIAFNEPGTPFKTKTHQITLTESTREANKRFFNDEIDQVPRFAATMGIDTIMQAKEVIVSAFGEKKAKAIYQMLRGEVTEDCPASVLQRHPNVKVILDEEAAKYIFKKGFKDENINNKYSSRI